MHIAIILWSLFAAWRWGDWKNWKKYHATMLFYPFANLVYGLLVNDPDFYLWRYHGHILLSEETADLFYSIITFPAVTLVFLSNYPANRFKQFLHITKYVAIYAVLEFIAHHIGAISYANHWNFLWSIWFNFISFSVIRLHYKKPLLAYTISVLITSYLLWHFGVPLKDQE
ncbi:CBO0543 family protein [Brevibacillus migulae]|uniref:CBO0543 family protein n=1 Tax=Brevibacillus migulae TaxID=1644114 RepID=UPI00106E6973|nr:CBO0543 family protein [Brevibacillus migulae]